MATRKKTTSSRKGSTTSKRTTKRTTTRRKTTSSRRRQTTRRQREINLAWLFSERFWGLILLVTATYTILSLLAPNQGQLTRWWLGTLSPLFGFGLYFLPFLLAAWGFWLVRSGYDGSYRFPVRYFWSSLVAWLLFLIIATAMGGDGGYTGAWLAETLIAGLGTIGFWLLSIVVVLVLVAVFFQITLADLIAAWKMARASQSEQPPSPSPAKLVKPSGSSFLQRWLSRRGGGHVTVEEEPALVINGGQVIQRSASPSRPIHVLGNGDESDRQPVQTPRPALSSPPARSKPEPARQSNRPLEISWQLPNVAEIFDDVSDAEIDEDKVLQQRAHIIEETLAAFGVPAKVVEANRGPAVTQFGVRPGYIERVDKRTGQVKRTKIKVAKIQSLTKDLALALSAAPIRIEAPIPGRALVGVEVPNRVTSTVSLRSMLESEQFRQAKGELKIALGRDVSGSAYVTDLVKMPHLLIAGATGSGKSVCVNGIISCLLTTHTPETLRVVMIDPKMVELINFNGIPHLYGSVVTDIGKAVGILKWAVRQMEGRYRLFNKLKVRNLDAYNKLVEEERTKAAAQAVLAKDGGAEMLPEAAVPVPAPAAFPHESLPYIAIFVDELADLMMAAGADVEILLVRLAQMARATGIHLVMSTQRPSVDVVTGLIKANFTARIAFNVTSQIDSRVILDVPGAEQLLGRGDMLFMSPDSSKLMRLQGAFVSDAETNRLVKFWRQQVTSVASGEAADGQGQPVLSGRQQPLLEDLIAEVEKASSPQRDVLFDKAVEVVRAEGRASVSLLQRRLRVGYTRAGRLMDQLEEAGVVGPVQTGGKPREVYAIGQERPPARRKEIAPDAYTSDHIWR